MFRFQYIAVLLLVALSPLAPMPLWAQDPFEENTRLGLFADPEGTQPCISIPQGEIGRMYLVATTGGQTANGFHGAEFRVEVSNADGYILSYEPPSNANVSLGNPLDIHPDETDPVGLNLAFPNCETLTGNAGDKIDLGSILVVNTAGGPTSLSIKRRSPPSNPSLNFPLLNACDAPLFSATPMGACTSGPTGGVVTGVAFLNEPSCDSGALCIDACLDPPRLRVEGRRTPEQACPGETVVLAAMAFNTGATAETIRFFVDGQPDLVFENVEPGDSVSVQRSFAVEGCAVGARYLFGVVAETATCALTAGREVSVGFACRANECDDGTDGCAQVFLEGPHHSMAGQQFTKTLRVGNGDVLRARNVFGVSGRIRYTRPDLVEFVELTCLDENGAPLSMGADAICVSTVNRTTGIVEFAVTRKRGDQGLFGSLVVARAVFRFPAELGGGFCAEVSLDDVRLINPNGNPLCYESSVWGNGVCTTSPCRVWPGDANRDGVVNAIDLQTMAGFWGTEGPPRASFETCSWGNSPRGRDVDCWPTYDAAWSDGHGDGRVGVEDVLCVGLAWGRTYDSPFEPIPANAGTSAQRKVAYEAMLQYMQGMSETDDGVQEATQALEELLAGIPVPQLTVLQQNIPNPFNPNTQIGFAMAQAGHARIEVFDVTGRHVRTLVDAQKGAGNHFTTWDGRRESGESVASGIYYYRAQLGTQAFSRKMVLTR